MNIAIGVLSWNNLSNIKILLSSIIEEINSMHNYNLIVVDNGSTDGSAEYLSHLENCDKFLLKSNKGIGIAKNIFIEYSKSIKSDYLFMFDSDVKVIKNSLMEMINWMNCPCNNNVACLGQFINMYTKNYKDEIIPDIFPKIQSVDLNMRSKCGAIRAWTHYAIYRTSSIMDISFDINDAFGKPGYGFDDDDLGMQIHEKEYDIACFKHVYIYHNISSSIKILKQLNQINYKERGQYFNEKWCAKLRRIVLLDEMINHGLNKLNE